MADEPHTHVPDPDAETPPTPQTPVSPDDSLTEEMAQSALKEYAAALREEFAEAQAKEAEEKRRPQDVEKAARDLFRTHAEEAALQIVWLAQNSDSESIRLRASTTVLKEAFEEGRFEGDPIRDLINGLFETTPEPAPDKQSGNTYTHEELQQFKNENSTS
jgi:hypothetical protein